MTKVLFSNQLPSKIVSRAFLQELANFVLENEKQSQSGSLSVALVGKEEIRKLKREFFGEDRYTDVISFNYGLTEKDSIWGEVVISLPVAEEQARERNIPVKEEVSYLFIHGLLHLLGYEDGDPESKKVMTERAKSLLAEFGKFQARKSLIKKAEKARALAYAPYSRFQVGAAIAGREGEVFTGCNIENASFGLTVCAERVALWKGVSAGVRDFSRIAIISTSSQLCLPCGACRQVLYQFSPGIEVVATRVDGSYQCFSLKELFAFPFTLSSEEE